MEKTREVTPLLLSTGDAWQNSSNALVEAPWQLPAARANAPSPYWSADHLRTYHGAASRDSIRLRLDPMPRLPDLDSSLAIAVINTDRTTTTTTSTHTNNQQRAPLRNGDYDAILSLLGALPGRV